MRSGITPTFMFVCMALQGKRTFVCLRFINIHCKQSRSQEEFESFLLLGRRETGPEWLRVLENPENVRFTKAKVVAALWWF